MILLFLFLFAFGICYPNSLFVLFMQACKQNTARNRKGVLTYWCMYARVCMWVYVSGTEYAMGFALSRRAAGVHYQAAQVKSAARWRDGEPAARGSNSPKRGKLRHSARCSFVPAGRAPLIAR